MASLLDGHFQEIGQDERPKRRPSGAAESARSRVQKKTVEDDVDDDDDTNDNGNNGVKVRRENRRKWKWIGLAGR